MGALGNYKPAMVLVALQFIYAGFILFTKRAYALGMSPRIFVVYRQAFATLIMLPIAYFSRRKAFGEPSFGAKSIAYIFVAALFGVTANQNLYYEGVKFSSSTLGGAISNLIPAITFVMATIVGLEKINIKSLGSIAKILGTIICVGGAVSMALVKGPKLFNANLGGENWLYGSICCFAGTCCWSVWLILQVSISECCPDHILSTTWLCLFGTLQSAILTLFLEPDLQTWKLHSTFEIVGSICCGVASVVSIIGQAWCISRRGPVFPATFSPLTTVIVTILAAILLHEDIYTTSMLGAIVVIAGLYVVLWGKAQDLKVQQKSDQRLQIDETTIVQGLVFDSSEKAISEVDLEEPLLSNKSSTAAQSATKT